MGLALFQPGMGDDASFEATLQTIQAYQTPPAGSGSILDTIMSSGSDLLKSITQPDVVKATLNKYLFGAPAPIPTATNLPVRTAPAPSTGQLIAGVPNLYLLLGAGAVLFLLRGKKR